MRRSDTTTRRLLLGGAAIAALWAVVLYTTGGIAIETRWRVISSRDAARPLLAAIAVAAWYVAVWRRHWRADLAPLLRLARPQTAGAAAVATALVVGLGWGSRIAAGPDPSGYVSEAAMFARGELTVDAPAWAQNAEWDDAAYSASPVGWHPTTQTRIIAPTYSPGLPLMLAAVERVAGLDAVFYVVPVLGALLVWSAYLLGTQLGGPWIGVTAAVLTVSSPTFLAMQLQVMSDVPVAALWTMSFVAALRGANPLLIGTAAAAAVLTRPNVVPLVLVPFMLVARRSWRLHRLAMMTAPIGIACATVAALNWRYHGSPLTSGYGPLDRLYSLGNVWPNLLQYARWFVELHTPLPLVGLAAFLVSTERRRTAVVTFVVPLALLALYVPFLVFQSWEWTYTRFLLPAYPALFSGVGIVTAASIARAPRRGVATAAAAVLVGAIAVRGWSVAIGSGVFTQRSGDARYARAVDYANQLPDRSILLSNAHSGTLHFYTGRDVLRFEKIRREELDTAVTSLRRQGYRLFLIGDDFEIDQFRNLFAGTGTAAALPQKPRASLGGVVVYEIHP